VIALLDDLAFLHYNYIISMANCRKSVSNNNGGNRSEALSNLVNCCLYLFLVLFIKSTGCFIQKQDFRAFNEGSGNCNSLLLSAGKLTSSISYISIDTILSHFFVDESPSISRFKGLNNFFICCFRVTIKKIFFDRLVE
jgi:hypothetical protein